MPTMTEITTKSTKLRRALRTEAARLDNGNQHDRKDASRLRAVAESSDSVSLARIFDLIMTHPTRDAAIQSLEDAGAVEGRPE